MICDITQCFGFLNFISASSYFRKVCKSRIVRSLKDMFGTFAQCKCFSLKPPGSATHNLIAPTKIKPGNHMKALSTLVQ